MAHTHNKSETLNIKTTVRETHTFHVPTDKVGEAEKRVAKAAEKARNVGLEWIPSLEIGDAYMVAHPSGGMVSRTELTLSFPVLKVSEHWEILATAHIVNSGKNKRTADEVRNERCDVVVTAARGVVVPADSWNITHTCDHCTYVRWRNLYYVLSCVKETSCGTKSYKVGDVVKVGSSCVSEFLGKGTMGLIDAMWAVVSWGENTQEKAESWGYSEKPTYSVTALIAFALDTMRQDVAQGRDAYSAVRNGQSATYYRAYQRWYATEVTKEVKAYPMSQDVVELAGVMYDWVCDGMEHSDKFARNLHGAVTPAYIQLKDMQKWASIIVGGIMRFAYKVLEGGKKDFPHIFGAHEETVEPKSDINPADLRKGDKVSLVGRCVRTSSGNGYYGSWWLYVFKSGSTEYTWFASKPQEIDKGVDVSLKGTFKQSKTFRGKKSYQLTRCTYNQA